MKGVGWLGRQRASLPWEGSAERAGSLGRVLEQASGGGRGAWCVSEGTGVTGLLDWSCACGVSLESSKLDGEARLSQFLFF